MSIKTYATFSQRWWNAQNAQARILGENARDGFPEGLTGSGGIDFYDNTRTYELDDVVIDPSDGRIFAANGNISVGAGIVIGTTGATWREISSSQLILPAYDSNRVYGKDAIVTHEGVIYRAKGVTVTGAFQPSYWDALSTLTSVYTLIKQHEATSTYVKDSVVYSGGKLYRAKTNLPAGAFDEADWDLILGDVRLIVREYATNEDYLAGELVNYDNRVYKALVDMSSPGVFDANNWAAVSSSTRINSFSGSNTYEIGDLVTHNDQIWRAQVATSTGPFAPDDWEEIGGRNRMRQSYQTGATYKRGEFVYHLGQLWRANDDLVAGGTFEVGTAGATWKPVSRKGQIAPFELNTFYAEDDLVLKDRIIYRRIASGRATAWTESEWEYKYSLASNVLAYDGMRTYEPGDLALLDGDLYYANEQLLANTDGSSRALDRSKWRRISGRLRGAFSDQIPYFKDDVVFHNNNLYRANGNRPAGGFSEGTTSTQFTRLAPPSNPSAPDWAQSQDYKDKDLVIRGGKLYRAKEDHNSGSSFDTSKWESLKAEAVTTVPTFAEGEDYILDQLVVKEGVLYRSRTEITNAQAADIPGADWQAVSLTHVALPNHSDANTYQLDELTIHQGKLYRANKEISTPATFSEDDWDAVSVEEVLVPDHDQTKAYSENELVVYEDNLYRAIADIPEDTAWDSDNFTAINRNPYRGEYDSTKDYLIGDVIHIHDGLYEVSDIGGIPSGTPLEDIFSNDLVKRLNDGLGVRRFSDYPSNATILPGDVVEYDWKLYRCNDIYVKSGPWEVDKFEFIGWLSTLIPEYDDSETYRTGQIVQEGNFLWRCVNSINTPEPFEENDWVKIASLETVVEDHDQARAYQSGIPVIFDNKMYVSRNAVAANTAFDATSGDWLLVSSDTTESELWAPATAVTAGEIRILNGIAMVSKSARTTGAVIDDSELSNWTLRSATTVTTTSQTTLAWSHPEQVPVGTEIGFDGSVAGTGNTLTITGSLPSSDTTVLKSLGYRWLLNGYDITSSVSAGGSGTFTLQNWLESGDSIQIVEPA